MSVMHRHNTTTFETRTYSVERNERSSERTTREIDADERYVCPECGGRLVEDEAHGETTCRECGLVVDEDEVDHGPEWRAFNSQDRDSKSRVGAPTTKLMHDKGLSTNIGWGNRDAYGKTLSARQRQTMQRLRTWDERFRTRNSKERNLKQALGEIERMGSALGLSKSVRETAAVVYRRALEEDLLPGRSIEGVATASVYAALRQAGVPQSIDDVVMVSRVDEMEFKRAYRYINRELGLEIAPPDPEQYLAKYASELAVSDELEAEARTLLHQTTEQGLHSGKNPIGLVAAALYAAGLLIDEKLTQAEVSDAANVSEVTIRNRYKELLEIKDATENRNDGTATAADAVAG